MGEAAVEGIADDNISGISLEREPVVSHFWVCSYPFFETTLFVIPDFKTSVSKTGVHSSITLYDPDGDVVNELSIVTNNQDVGIVELGATMGACKIESGLKHGHMVVTSPAGYRHECRISTREKGAMLGKPAPFSLHKATFFPVLFGDNRASFLAVMNKSEEDATVKCRLYCGKRTPNMECVIPARGVRVISVADEFPDYCVTQEGKRIQAYVRLATKGSAKLGVLLFERTRMLRDTDFYCSVS